MAKLQSKASFFYEINGAPGWGIEAPSRKKEKVFVQTTSLGSRCLKNEAYVFYKVIKHASVKIIIVA